MLRIIREKDQWDWLLGKSEQFDFSNPFDSYRFPFLGDATSLWHLLPVISVSRTVLLNAVRCEKVCVFNCNAK